MIEGVNYVDNTPNNTEDYLKLVSDSLLPVETEGEKFLNWKIIDRVIPRTIINKIGFINPTNCPLIVLDDMSAVPVRSEKIGTPYTLYNFESNDFNLLDDETKADMIEKLSHETLYALELEMVEKLKKSIESVEISEDKLVNRIKKTAKEMVKQHNGHNGNISILVSPRAYALCADELKKDFPSIKLVWNQAEVQNQLTDVTTNTAIVCFVDTQQAERSLVYRPYTLITCAKKDGECVNVDVVKRDAFIIKDTSKFKVFKVVEKKSLWDRILKFLFHKN